MKGPPAEGQSRDTFDVLARLGVAKEDGDRDAAGADALPLPQGRDAITSTVIPRLIRWRSRREPRVCHIAEALATEIVFQDLKPGAALNSVDLAKRFGVSRTPVREALALLEQEGLIEIHARRIARVASIDLEEVREIYRLRAHLLALMVRELVPKVTDEQIEVLGQIVARLRLRSARNDRDGFFSDHIEWQNRMLEFAGDQTLKRVLDSLALRVLVVRYMSGGVPGRLAMSVLEQEQILGAIVSRDADLAAAAMAHSINQAFRTLEGVMRPNPRPAASAEMGSSA